MPLVAASRPHYKGVLGQTLPHSSSLNTAFQYISITSFHIIIEDVSNSREITSFLLAYGTLRGVIRLDLLGGQLEEVEDYRITVYVF